MNGCQFILSQDYPKLQQVPVEIIKARGKVVSLIYCYNFKFGEFFQKYTDPMFQSIWQLIENKKVQPTKQSEKLVRVVVKYMGEMTKQPNKAAFIKTNLSKVFDILILPNISLNQEDIDEYEDDPDAYIRNDLEESDIETKRRHCMKFVQQLSTKFQEDVGSLISNYVQNYLSQYQTNREQFWDKKDSLLNLLITACIGQYNYKGGANELTIPLETLNGYIQGLAVPELQEQDINKLPIMKATCIKFVYMFRN